MKYFFSPSACSVYPSDMHEVYQAAGTLPDDLVEINEAEYQHYFLSPVPSGQQLSVDENGKPCFIEVVTDIEDMRINAIDMIDNTAAHVTSKWTRFTTEYEESEKAAIEYKAAGYEGDVSIFITSYADAAGVSYQEATDTILIQADGLRNLQAQLRAQRMRKYELKAADLTLEQITTLRDEIITNIQTLGASHD